MTCDHLVFSICEICLQVPFLFDFLFRLKCLHFDGPPQATQSFLMSTFYPRLPTSRVLKLWKHLMLLEELVRVHHFLVWQCLLDHFQLLLAPLTLPVNDLDQLTAS